MYEEKATTSAEDQLVNEIKEVKQTVKALRIELEQERLALKMQKEANQQLRKFIAESARELTLIISDVSKLQVDNPVDSVWYEE